MATDSQPIELNDLLIKELECPVCLDHCTPPVYMCPSGHNLCSMCVKKIEACPVCRDQKPTYRNRLAETTIANLRFPCRNVDSGCKARFSLQDLKAHVQKCVFNSKCKYYTSVSTSDRGHVISSVCCPWSGDRLGLVAHVQVKHLGCFLNNIADLGAFVNDGFHNKLFHSQRLVCVDGEYFWLMCEYCNKKKPKLGWYRLICIVVGGEEVAERYGCVFNFRSEDGAYEQMYRIPVRSQFDKSIEKNVKSIDVDESMMRHFKDKNGDLKCSILIFLK